MNSKIDKLLTDLLFERRESEKQRLSYNKEMHIYENIKQGNLDSIDESVTLFKGDGIVKLSSDEVRNYKYLFVAATTLATRFVIEGGLDSETAYSLSDIYIRQVDILNNVQEITELYRKLLTDFTTRVKKVQKNNSCSKPILIAKEYIHAHIHYTITVEEIAEHVHLSQSYFSTLFKQETGVNVSEYIRQRRIDAAENLLRYSDFSYLDISNYLAFSSHSHFVSVFKKETGLTPRQYRQKYYSPNWTETER